MSARLDIKLPDFLHEQDEEIRLVGHRKGRMSVKFLLDENISSVLREAIRRFNEDAALLLEVVRRGSPVLCSGENF